MPAPWRLGFSAASATRFAPATRRAHGGSTTGLAGYRKRIRRQRLSPLQAVPVPALGRCLQGSGLPPQRGRPLRFRGQAVSVRTWSNSFVAKSPGATNAPAQPHAGIQGLQDPLTNGRPTRREGCGPARRRRDEARFCPRDLRASPGGQGVVAAARSARSAQSLRYGAGCAAPTGARVTSNRLGALSTHGLRCWGARLLRCRIDTVNPETPVIASFGQLHSNHRCSRARKAVRNGLQQRDRAPRSAAVDVPVQGGRIVEFAKS